MMGDDMEQREDEPYQDESALVVENVDNSNCKAVDSEVSTEEEVCCQRSVKNDSVIRGILKNRPAQSGVVEHLGLSLLHEETVASADFSGLEKGDHCDSAVAFADVTFERGTAQRPTLEFDELLRHDELGSVVLKQTEDKGKCKGLSLFSESCSEEVSHLPLCAEASLQDNCSQDGVPDSHVLHACLDLVGYVNGVGSSTSECESVIQATEVENQSSVSVVTLNIAVEDENKERLLVNSAKDSEQHAIASESPLPDFSLGELAIAEVRNIGKEIEDVCQPSDLESEVPETLVDMNEIFPTQSVDESQHLNLDNQMPNHVPSPEAIHQVSSNLNFEDQTHQFQTEMQVPELVTLTTETMVTNRANGVRLPDFSMQILQPILNSFLFPENAKECQENVVLKSEDGIKQSDLESTYRKTPLGEESAEEYQENGILKSEDSIKQSDLESTCPKTPMGEEKISEGSVNVVSGQKLSMTNLSFSTHQVSTSHTKGKMFESCIRATEQQWHSGSCNKLTSEALLTDLDNGKDEIEMCAQEENFTHNAAPMQSNASVIMVDENKINVAMSDRPCLLKVSCSPFRKSTSKSKIADKLWGEMDMYTPDNVTPNFQLQKSIMNMLDQNELISPVSWRSSSSKVASSAFQMEQDLFASDKENQTPIIFMEKKQARSNFTQKKGKNIHLQSILIDSCGKSLTNVSYQSVGSVSPVRAERIKISPEMQGRVKWHMVVDSASLLIGESRKELQLLQGIRGTQLIVPRTVLKELESLEQPTSLCGRTAEVTAALSWLRDCMVKTEWWIHIECSSEEEKHLAPTPPASPWQQHSSLALGHWSWTPSFIFRNFVPSSKAEDVLQCALHHSSFMDSGGKVVILSDDFAIKIKAMAEGLTCEAASEFRKSLINPFSDRFLWAGSSPRGQTWSISDDVIVEEWFYSSHLKKSLKAQESVKGLKLLLPLSSTVKANNCIAEQEQALKLATVIFSHMTSST
uniref:PIN domain-containing protein n=1 Tax=Kalanchoe fedtschenkoi TaxID=63787 RepID=A0A7N0UZV8_KALFE